MLGDFVFNVFRVQKIVSFLFCHGLKIIAEFWRIVFAEAGRRENSCYNLPMKIKKCGLNDVLDLQKIYRQTFYETFATQNSEENMRKFLDEAYSEQKLKSELEDKESETFLAVENQKTLGVLKINTGNAETESGFENSLEIQRIYVLKEAKGLGIGTAFMNLAEKKARELGVSFIWLGVWEKNFPAQKFYTDKGFRKFSEHSFVLGDDVQTDFLMKKELC